MTSSSDDSFAAGSSRSMLISSTGNSSFDSHDLENENPVTSTNLHQLKKRRPRKTQVLFEKLARHTSLALMTLVFI